MKDEIPADHLSLYAEREGAWVLDVDGAVDKSKHDEFRTTNFTLLKERDDLKKRYEGIDPDEVRNLAVNGLVLDIDTLGGEGAFPGMARKLSVELPGAVYRPMNRGGQSEPKGDCASLRVVAQELHFTQ